MMQLWLKAASALPYTDDVGGCVVVSLSNMASSDELLSHIPMVAWDWLNKRPVLSPEFVALLPRINESMVQAIQQLGGGELIVSYLHVFWSEEHKIWHRDMSVMRRLIREELGGIGATGHRTDLIRRLDYVVLQLDQGQGKPSARRRYEGLRRELLMVDEEAMRILTGTSSSCHLFLSTDSRVHVQDVILPSCAHSLFRARSCVFRRCSFLSCLSVNSYPVPFPCPIIPAS